MPDIKSFLAAAKNRAISTASAASPIAYGALALGVAGGAAYYGGAKAYNAVNQSIFEPYSMSNPRSIGREGISPNEPMMFSSSLREQHRRGMTPGQFADNGDLTLSLSNLRRG